MVKQVARGPQRFGDFAYFPGSGPPGAMCRSCKSFLKKTVPNNPHAGIGVCELVAELRNIKAMDLKKIQGSTPACRYYVLAKINGAPRG